MSSEGSGRSARSGRLVFPASTSAPSADASGSIRIGRYALHGILAAGGMATVHLARLIGEAGFSRTVAVKRLHPNFAQEQEFVAMLLDEARLVARIRHPNVVPMLDVVREPSELFLVMEYVHGESWSRLIAASLKRGREVPVPICAAIAIDVLNGLHAAHEARNERGEPLGIVHRDVSPQNAIVGVDGVTRVLDFGVAKASGRLQSTQNDELKGKLAYMSPQQIMGEPVDRRADVWSAAVCLWESLAGARLFKAEVQATVAVKVLNDAVEPPSKYRPEIPKALDDVLMKGLAREPDERYATARDMAIAIEEACPPATARAVGEWVSELAAEALGSRATRIEEIESAVEPNPSLGKLLAAVPLDTPSSRSVVTSPEVAASSETSSSATAARLGLARDEAPPPAASKSRSSVIVAAALVSVALVAAALIVSRRAPNGATAAAPPAPPLPSASVTAAPTAVTSAAAPLQSAAPPAAAPAPSAPTVAKHAPSKPAPTPAKTTAKPAAPAPNCSPNFVIEGGIKKIKPECL
ncbi:MAG: serine/threonine protein kinase [Myxococcales bacterium]|nr:serine/threonine protein kinase [Myxococcales bacterium]